MKELPRIVAGLVLMLLPASFCLAQSSGNTLLPSQKGSEESLRPTPSAASLGENKLEARQTALKEISKSGLVRADLRTPFSLRRTKRCWWFPSRPKVRKARVGHRVAVHSSPSL